MASSKVSDLIYALNPANLKFDDSLSKYRRLQAMELLDASFAQNPEIGPQVMSEIANFLGRLAPFKEENRNYAWTAEAVANMEAFWCGYYQDTKLSKVVKALKSMVLSSASAERNFSIRGTVHTKSRNRLRIYNSQCF